MPSLNTGMAEPIIGWGGTVEFTISGSSEDTLDKVLSVDCPAGEQEFVEFLALDSANKVKEKVLGAIAPGEFSCESVFDATVFEALHTARKNGTSVAWVVTYPDGNAEYSFNSKLKSVESALAPEEFVKMTINAVLVGDVTFDDGSS